MLGVAPEVGQARVHTHYGTCESGSYPRDYELFTMRVMADTYEV